MTSSELGKSKKPAAPAREAPAGAAGFCALVVAIRDGSAGAWAAGAAWRWARSSMWSDSNRGPSSSRSGRRAASSAGNSGRASSSPSRVPSRPAPGPHRGCESAWVSSPYGSRGGARRGRKPSVGRAAGCGGGRQGRRSGTQTQASHCRKYAAPRRRCNVRDRRKGGFSTVGGRTVAVLRPAAAVCPARFRPPWRVVRNGNSPNPGKAVRGAEKAQDPSRRQEGDANSARPGRPHPFFEVTDMSCGPAPHGFRRIA